MARSRSRQQLGGAPRRSKYARRPPGEERRLRGGTAFVVGLFALLLGGAAGWATEMDRQVRGGVLEQRLVHRGRPDWVRLESLPPHLTDALVAAAGPEFWGERPASRLRNTYLARDLVRQVHLLDPGAGGEARARTMGPLLETHLTSKSLVELYVNRAYLGRERGQPLFGIRPAAREYFGKTPAQLSVSEAATLAGLLLPPRIDNPRDFPGAVGARRNEVLRRLLAAGKIDAAAFRAALTEPLGFQPGLRFQPMSRPADWAEPLEPLRAPPDVLPLSADTSGAAPAAAPIRAE